MTHFVALVVAETEEEIEALVAPYHEELEVEPYFQPVDVERMVEYAKKNDMNVENPIDLVEWWNNTPGVFNEAGEIGYMSTYNPDSEWDWYSVGGRWNDIATDNRCLAEDVEGIFETLGYMPSVIVDADGWHQAKEYGWFGSSSPVEGNEYIVANKLAQYTGKNVFIVDFHI
jgi:hypothetical protein